MADDFTNRGDPLTDRQVQRRDKRLAAGKTYHGGWAGKGQGIDKGAPVGPSLPTFGGGMEGNMPGLVNSGLFSGLVNNPYTPPPPIAAAPPSINPAPPMQPPPVSNSFQRGGVVDPQKKIGLGGLGMY